MQGLVKKLEGEVRGGLVPHRVGLCSLLLLLALLVSVNIGLTIWLLTTLHFDMDGTGPIKYVAGGLRVEGATHVHGELVASRVAAGEPTLTLLGDRQVTLESGDSSLTIKHNTELRAASLTVSDSLGSPLLSVSPAGVVLGRGRLTATAAAIGEVLQAGRVKSRVGRPLFLESPTGTVTLTGPAGVSLSSPRGNLSLSAHSAVRIQANTGQIVLDSPTVLLPRLPLAAPSSSPSPAAGLEPTVFQVCVCSNGRLFLAPGSGSCLARTKLCLEE